MFCRHCGREIDPEYRFCIYCGGDVISPENKISADDDNDAVSNFVTLTGEDGEDVQFEFLDLISHRGNDYIVLLPMDEMADEVIILQVEVMGDQEENYVSVDDENLLNEVYELFQQRNKDFFNFQNNDTKTVFDSNGIGRPDGFYIIERELGEIDALNLFRAAEADNIEAQMKIAGIFMDATEQPLAFPWFKRAADLGNAHAMYELTFFYEDRYVGVDGDAEKAEEMLNRAIDGGSTKAIIKLAERYEDMGEEGLEKAFSYYNKAAELGDEEAKALVGMCYLNGEGVAQDNNLAFQWFSQSKDDYYSAFHLAKCYLEGIGTKVDEEAAIPWLEKCVKEKGWDFSEARDTLISLYERGLGGRNGFSRLAVLKTEKKKSSDLLDELASMVIGEMDDN